MVAKTGGKLAATMKRRILAKWWNAAMDIMLAVGIAYCYCSRIFGWLLECLRFGAIRLVLLLTLRRRLHCLPWIFHISLANWGESCSRRIFFPARSPNKTMKRWECSKMSIVRCGNNRKKQPRNENWTTEPNERKWNRMETDKYNMKTIRKWSHTHKLAQIYIVSELDEIRERQTYFDFSQLQCRVCDRLCLYYSIMAQKKCFFSSNLSLQLICTHFSDCCYFCFSPISLSLSFALSLSPALFASLFASFNVDLSTSSETKHCTAHVQSAKSR